MLKNALTTLMKVRRKKTSWIRPFIWIIEVLSVVFDDVNTTSLTMVITKETQFRQVTADTYMKDTQASRHSFLTLLFTSLPSCRLN